MAGAIIFLNGAAAGRFQQASSQACFLWKNPSRLLTLFGVGASPKVPSESAVALATGQ